VDKLMVFTAPTVSGAGPVAFGALPESHALQCVSVERVGDDVLLTGYLREP
jgi:riboflavin biosynthesis pyrimidine reductase